MLLWDKLNRYIGYRETILLRQTRFRIRDIVNNIGEDCQIVSSGSMAEGLSLPGSDFDQMTILSNITVVPEQLRYTSDNLLFMDTHNVKPGFTKLYMIPNRRKTNRLGLFASALTPVNGNFLLSSFIFRDIVVAEACKSCPNPQPHGPCATFSVNGNEHDLMSCLSCKSWPCQAQEWIHRRRINNWPPQHLINEIIQEGCLLVPVGNPLSEQCYIEWRVSFSLAEKKLMHSMNQVQFVCYGLLKLYLKHAIDSREDCKGLLCSYFLKTALFYCMEDNKELVWEKFNILNCFWACIKRLIQWIRDGYCPNYFIKRNNMFESKIFGDSQKRLHEHLFNLYDNGLDSLTKIPVLSSLNGDILASRFDHKQNEIETNKLREEQFDITPCFCFYFNKTHVKTILAFSIKIQRLLTHPSTSMIEYVVLNNFNTHCLISLTQPLYKEIINSPISNKSRYKELQKLLRYILRNCMEIDICTGWLQYATLCYLSGKNRKVIAVVEDVLEKFKPFVIYSGFREVQCRSEYTENMCGKGYSYHYKLTNSVANSYVCVPSYGFYPKKIREEIKRHEDKGYTYIPPRVYCCVLIFLTYHRTGQTDLINLSLERLIESADDQHFVDKYERPMALALVQRCVEIATDSS